MKQYILCTILFCNTFLYAANDLDDLFDNFLHDDDLAEYYRGKKRALAYACNWKKLRKVSTKIQQARLLKACEVRNWQVAKDTIRKNKNVNPNISSYYNPLFPLLYAVQAGSVDMANFLLTHKADPNKRYRSPQTPSIGCMGRLLYYDIWADNKTALFDAVHLDNPALVWVLLQHNADVNAKTTAGLTPLDMALNRERYTGNTFDIVHMLIKKKLNINTQEHIIVVIDGRPTPNKSGGMTPLMKAAQKCSLMTKLLLECGANNLKSRDAHDKTAIDYAREAGFSNTVQLLQQAASSLDCGTYYAPKTVTMYNMIP